MPNVSQVSDTRRVLAGLVADQLRREATQRHGRTMVDLNRYYGEQQWPHDLERLGAAVLADSIRLLRDD